VIGRNSVGEKKESFILDFFISRRPVKFASGVPNVVALDFLCGA
jgi:hypothetical protein